MACVAFSNYKIWSRVLGVMAKKNSSSFYNLIAKPLIQELSEMGVNVLLYLPICCFLVGYFSIYSREEDKSQVS